MGKKKNQGKPVVMSQGEFLKNLESKAPGFLDFDKILDPKAAKKPQKKQDMNDMFGGRFEDADDDFPSYK